MYQVVCKSCVRVYYAAKLLWVANILLRLAKGAVFFIDLEFEARTWINEPTYCGLIGVIWKEFSLVFTDGYHFLD